MFQGQKINFNSYEELEKYISENEIAFVDAVFCDPLGLWHHCAYTTETCSADQLRTGYIFDGSSIRLFTNIESSDMRMIPDFTTCWIDPFYKKKTLHIICNIHDPITYEPYQRCPRQIAKKAVAVLRRSNIGDVVYFGCEPEFFIFDGVRLHIDKNDILASIDAQEGPWKNAEPMSSVSPGCRLQNKQMYLPVPPIDQLADIRGEILLILRNLGLRIEKHHHETAICQCELGFKYDNLVQTADNMLTCKYVVKNVAKLFNKTATFMPKPVYKDAGSGCHLHQSIWKNNKNLFFDSNNEDKYCLSDTALFYIGGIFKHAASLCAFTNPTTNSFKRLVPGFEAPSKLAYAQANRSAAIRIPITDKNQPELKRFECRFPDGSSCPYLAFSALLLAGIDGICNKMRPPEPYTKNVYLEMSDQIPSLPSSLNEALDALEKDHAFLSKDSVFTEDFIMDYIKYKRLESDSVMSIPHPKEYELYFNN